ncbi:sensor histidine kinase [Sphingomonas endolithica]|uniref:sensor histidine kinase n=1 Tax=Sphingomonas endolithica TaxID=2972485 RepID=UPI0021AEAC70|nr:HAMP domain-containing sensor histidine kinase [Sphingomonas sp. ZFBP2030]
MRLKAFLKRHWPALSLRTILFSTLLFVAALPGVAALSLRVYENTLVQQTEAELIAQGAVLASAYRIAWGSSPGNGRSTGVDTPQIDLRTNTIWPRQPDAVRGQPPEPHAVRVAHLLAPTIADAVDATLAATRLLDGHGVVVVGRGDRGLSYAALPEVRRALAGRNATVLRQRIVNPYGFSSLLELLSPASAIRVHHARPVIVGGRVVGVVMLSRSPRGLFRGIYQDRGKIALGAGTIFAILVVLAGLLSRGIARPIRGLTLATEHVASGRIDIPAPPATAATEIRELYVNFASMARQIDTRARYLRDFAAAVSHEFKTPLAGINGVIELLQDHGDTMPRADRLRFLDNAAKDTDRLSRLVQRLLDMARADMLSIAPDVRSDAAAVARRIDGGGLHIVVTAPHDLPQARIADDVLETVLTTLAENSRQAGATALTIALLPAPSGISITVADDGPGIDADRDRLFEPFFTGNRAAGGTGLGLPIARSLLAATGGTIDIAPSGRGAAFVIMIPA